MVTLYYRGNYKPNKFPRNLNNKDRFVMFNRDFDAFLARGTTQPIDRDYLATMNAFDFADHAVAEAAMV